MMMRRPARAAALLRRNIQIAEAIVTGYYTPECLQILFASSPGRYGNLRIYEHLYRPGAEHSSLRNMEQYNGNGDHL